MQQASVEKRNIGVMMVFDNNLLATDLVCVSEVFVKRVEHVHNLLSKAVDRERRVFGSTLEEKHMVKKKTQEEVRHNDKNINNSRTKIEELAALLSLPEEKERA